MDFLLNKGSWKLLPKPPTLCGFLVLAMSLLSPSNKVFFYEAQFTFLLLFLFFFFFFLLIFFIFLFIFLSFFGWLVGKCCVCHSSFTFLKKYGNSNYVSLHGLLSCAFWWCWSIFSMALSACDERYLLDLNFSHQESHALS